MRQMDFTYEDVLAEVRRLSAQDPDGFTVNEMAEHTGRGAGWCRSRLSQLIAGNRVRHNGFATRRRIDGKPCQVPVYVYVGADP